MTRAVLLPAGSDPFLNAYWLRHYRTWADSVDELHIAVCGPLPEDVLAYTQACVESVGGTMYHIPKRTEHGHVLTFLLDQTSADHVLLIEDDAFIRRPEVIDEAFYAIERGETDLIGCPRNSYATENVIGAARRRFGDEPQGLAFWPCFLFVSREALAATDRGFGGTRWNAGDTVLGTTLAEPAIADTFIWASYQLREQGLRVQLRNGERLGDKIGDGADWFHVGSLSSGHGNLWQGDMPAERYEAEVKHWQGVPASEAAKRMAWWQRAWDCWDGEIPDYHAAYEAGFRQFMADFGVKQGQVSHMRAGYDPLVTWAER
jgi:hypothetical protein